jgi:protein-S-isoprenylcysteine O-methyltransferase Ste14
MKLLADPLHVVYLVCFVAYAAIRHVYEGRAKGATTSLSRIDALEKVLLALVFSGTLPAPLLYLFSPWLSFADYTLPTVVRAAGVALMLVSLWLFWRSHADLGRNWSVSLELKSEHQLVRHGVYRRVRHPMYAAIALWGLSQGCLLENWLAGWGALAAFLPMFLLRTPREERMMLERFGDEYRQYMQATGRIVPKLSA